MGLWIMGIVFTLALLVLGAYAVGARLPEKHSAEASAFTPNQPPEVVAARIRNVETSGMWRRGVSAVVLAREGSSVIFEETGPDGTVTYRRTETVPNAEIINEIVSEGLPYGGRWTIRIAPAGHGSNVTIREDGFVKPPLFRFLARFVFGYSGSIDRYLKELAAAGESQ